MSALAGTVSIGNPLHIPEGYLPYPLPDWTPEVRAFRAPNGTTWVSKGAYEQALQLDAAKKRIAELEAQVADLSFPVRGMSGEFSKDSRALWVWPTQQQGSYSRL